MHSKSVQFLSTPSARRATATAGIGSTGGYNFYPRPPRGGRPGFVLLDMIACYFYPRPPRGGRPGGLRGAGHRLADFYPRPPRGGRRDVLLRAAAHSSISIHALREEGDAGSSCGASCRSRFLSTPSARRATGLPGRSAGRPDNFYPRPPRGGRPRLTLVCPGAG